MKKITLSVAALGIAISSFGQCERYKVIHGETNEVKTLTKLEWVQFQNEINGFTKFIDNSLCNKVNVFELSEIANTAEDIIEWIIEDEASGNVGREQADTYIDNLDSEEDVIRSLIHECVHSNQCFDIYEALYECDLDYDTHPYEIEAEHEEENWIKYKLC